MPKCREGLLEWLLLESGGGYMSDLRCGVRKVGMTKVLHSILRRVPVDAWTTSEWADAVAYLTNQNKLFSTQGEYVSWLTQYLEKT